MSSASDREKTAAVPDLAELESFFTNKGVRPKMLHGMGTMLGFHPWLGDRIYWFNWDPAGPGFRHAITNRTWPDDVELLDLQEDAKEVVSDGLDGP